jgi:hypothetical protein
MPGPELQVRQALPKPWTIDDGRRLSVERADFATASESGTLCYGNGGYGRGDRAAGGG